MDSHFEVPNLEQLRTIENKPHHLLETDLLQLKQFQYQFFHNITLNAQTIPQIRIFSLFLKNFFRFNYQLRWNDQGQNAFINFSNHLTNDELLPFMPIDEMKHSQYLNLSETPKDHTKYECL